jgi:hypothetical protein
MSDDWNEDESEGASELADKFYRGTVEKLFRGSRVGVVRSGSGREIPFEFLHVTMVGPLRLYEDLREGMRVGYDVGWTSKGLRVTVIRAGGDEDKTRPRMAAGEEPDGDG